MARNNSEIQRIDSDESPRDRGLRGGESYPPRLMAAEMAARYVGFGQTKFRELIESGLMPRSIDVDGSPRWDRYEIDYAVDDLRDGRADPVRRGRDILDKRLREQESGK